MTNKGICKIWGGLIIITFCLGFYSGYTGEQASGIMGLMSLVCLGVQVWGMKRLWNS